MTYYALSVILSKKPIIFEDKTGFGQRLTEARKKKGLTQAYVAEFLGVSQASVGRWEAGQAECSLGALDKMSKLYGESLDYLITGKRLNDIADIPGWLRPHLISLSSLGLLDQGKVLGALQLLGVITPTNDSDTTGEENQIAVAGAPRNRNGTR